MFLVKFTNFRAFQDTGLRKICPITFLVGENSAGKTSFLAGIRYLLESFSRGSSTPFNRAPYFLGGFQQIAHYRGGRGGRRSEFSLSIELPDRLPRVSRTGRRRYMRPDRDFYEGPATHTFRFESGSPQPQLASYTLSGAGLDLEYSFTEERPSLSLTRLDTGQVTSRLKMRRAPPSKLIRDDSSSIDYLFEDFRFSDFDPSDKHPLSELISTEQARGIWRLAMSTTEFMGQSVFASAPVRTQPYRTYTPSELVASAEGSHVPLELAKLKLRSPNQWLSVKEGLVSFGVTSGLFTDIDIKQFGRSDIDPFQILIRVGGPAMNLVDVGYGISQALPIVYQIQNPSAHSTFLLQQPEVHLHPRAQAALGTLLAHSVNDKFSFCLVESHSDYMIGRVRIEVAEGRLKSEDVTILFFRRDTHGATVDNLYLNKNGEIENAPPDFRAFFLEEHSRLLGIS